MRLSLTIDPFRPQLLLLLPPYPEVDHQTMLQGILTSKVGSRSLSSGLTPLSIFGITQVGSSLKFNI